jgi:hypothetical protein
VALVEHFGVTVRAAIVVALPQNAPALGVTTRQGLLGSSCWVFFMS